MTDALLFAKSKSDHFTGVAFALVFAAAAFAIAFGPINVPFRSAGVILALGLALISLRTAIGSVPESSTTVLNPDGLVFEWGLIPWSEVSRCWFASAGVVLMLCIELRDAKKFNNAASKNGLLPRFNQMMRLGDIQLPVAWSHRTRDEVEQFVRRFAKFV